MGRGRLLEWCTRFSRPAPLEFVAVLPRNVVIIPLKLSNANLNDNKFIINPPGSHHRNPATIVSALFAKLIFRDAWHPDPSILPGRPVLFLSSGWLIQAPFQKEESGQRPFCAFWDAERWAPEGAKFQRQKAASPDQCSANSNAVHFAFALFEFQCFALYPITARANICMRFRQLH